MSLASSNITELKQQIFHYIDNIPPEGLKELTFFLEYLRDKFNDQKPKTPQSQPVASGGIWKGVTISDDEIKDIRKEMWVDFVEN